MRRECKANGNKRQSDEDPGGVALTDDKGSKDSGTSNENPKNQKPQRDCLDIANLIILFLAFVAACIAAGEADRLANLTQTMMGDSKKFNEAQQRAFIFLKSMDRETETLGTDTLVKWRQTWRNNGVTQPKGLVIWSDCHDELMSVPLDVHRHIAQTKTFIGPNSEQTLVGCETSSSFLKQLDAGDIVRGLLRDNTRRLFYVFGGATYRDVSDTAHMMEFCYQLMWDNRKIDLGFELFPCDGVNASHNCVDEECPK